MPSLQSASRFGKPSRFFRQIALAAFFVAAPLFSLFVGPLPALAAASMSVGASATVQVGDTVNVTISVNTGGQSANAFQASFSYDPSLFDGVRGTYSGSICTLPISQPDPSGGSASFSCGRPSGYSGSGLVATIVLQAKATGTGTFGLSGCQVLANDGQGTDITGGCSGKAVTVNPGSGPAPTPTPSQSTPTPTPASGGTTTAAPTVVAGKTVKATPTPTPKPTPTTTPDNRPSVATETPGTAPTPAVPTPPPVAPLAATPTPKAQASATPGATTATQGKRSIGQAFKDIISSLGDIKHLTGNLTAVIALLIALVPFLALIFAILLLAYRLFALERRRRRTMDRLFEMELSELAALEGKLDLLGEKGLKGREQYREEFKKAKENILRELKPDFAKPVDPPAAAGGEKPAA